MSLLREYKSWKSNNQIDSELAEFFSGLDSVILDLKKHKNHIYPHTVFYMDRDGTISLLHDLTNGKLFVRFSGFMEPYMWDNDKFKNYGIEMLIEEIIKEKYGLVPSIMYDINDKYLHKKIDTDYVEDEYRNLFLEPVSKN